jgi:hypothetical protein
VYHSTYRGVDLYRNTEPGYRLRWSALGVGAADTLAGLKSLVRMKQTPIRLYGTEVRP